MAGKDQGQRWNAGRWGGRFPLKLCRLVGGAGAGAVLHEAGRHQHLHEQALKVCLAKACTKMWVRSPFSWGFIDWKLFA